MAVDEGGDVAGLGGGDGDELSAACAASGFAGDMAGGVGGFGDSKGEESFGDFAEEWEHVFGAEEACGDGHLHAYGAAADGELDGGDTMGG